DRVEERALLDDVLPEVNVPECRGVTLECAVVVSRGLPLDIYRHSLHVSPHSIFSATVQLQPATSSAPPEMSPGHAQPFGKVSSMSTVTPSSAAWLEQIGRAH